MAAASYATDLVVFKDLEAATTLGEMIGYTLTGAPALDLDYPIQGIQHASATMTKTGLGSVVADYGSNLSWTSGWAFFTWAVFTAPAAVDTFANGGLRFLLGSDITANYKGWKIGGRDFGSYPYGGWQNFAVDPEQTADYTGGTLAGYRWVGVGVNCTNAISKGNPVGLDCIRYGRGQLAVTGGDGSGYGTFAGMAGANDAPSARWGLFKEIPGGYLWKGLMSLGTAATAVDFRDSNVNIYVDDTPKVGSDFNRIEISNTGSRVDFTGISITSLGTNARGNFEMIDDCDHNDNGSATYENLGTFIYKPGATLSNRTYRRCAQITLGGATMAGCVFDQSRAAIALACGASVATLSTTDFISSGAGHGIEITSGTTHVLSGITFAGYAESNGSTGNEAVYVNIPSGSVTINIEGGGSTPSIRTAGATVTVQNTKTIKVTVYDDSTGNPLQYAHVRLVKVADKSQVLSGETNVNGIVQGSFAYITDTPVMGWARQMDLSGTDYEQKNIDGIIDANGLTVSVRLSPI